MNAMLQCQNNSAINLPVGILIRSLPVRKSIAVFLGVVFELHPAIRNLDKGPSPSSSIRVPQNLLRGSISP